MTQIEISFNFWFFYFKCPLLLYVLEIFGKKYITLLSVRMFISFATGSLW